MTGVLFAFAVLLPLGAATQLRCADGSEQAFQLVLNADWRSVASANYITETYVNISTCARACAIDARCAAVAFIRNRTAPNECRLLSSPIVNLFPTQARSTQPARGTYYMEKMCLKGSCDRLFVLEAVTGMELSGLDDKVTRGVSRQTCLEMCVSETNFVCRSAEYVAGSQICRLSRKDRFSRLVRFVNAPADVTYYDNTCAYKPVNGGHTAEILLLGNVEHPYTLSEFTGLTASECGQQCLQNVDFPCRSFLFGRLEESPSITYCGLTHQNRAGFLRHDDAFEASTTLNYYEIARNVDACDSEDVKFDMVSGKKMLGRSFKQVLAMSPRECLQQCRNSHKCRSVSVDYRRRICHMHADTLRSGLDSNIKTDVHMNYFEKVCVSDPAGLENKCDTHWAFERVLGAELFGPDVHKILVEANTREECQAACLSQKNFVCHSAEFNSQLSECRLSPKSRLNSPTSKLRDTGFETDYFENNCIKEMRGFCNVKKIRNQKLLLADLVIGSISQEDCLQRCLKSEDFVCRSYTFEHESQTCHLSHHTHKSAPPGTLLKTTGLNLVELTTCFEVKVNCEADTMRAVVQSSKPFKGRIYARGHAKTCFIHVHNATEMALPIKLRGSDCGTKEEGEGHFSNILVIQANDQVVTATDRAIGISCTFDVSNKTGSTEIHVSDPKKTDRSSGRPQLPDLSLHILDMKGHEKDSAALGELLRVQVRMSDEDTYGIFVKNLVARDGAGSTNITLIDNFGCPVEAKMMREIRTLDSQSKSLESYLEAFAFTGSNELELEAEVVTCLERCRPVLCQIPTYRSDDDTETVTSYGRRRRDAGSEELARTRLVRSLSIRSPEYGLGASKLITMPPLTPPSAFSQGGETVDLEEFDDSLVCINPNMTALIVAITLCGETLIFSVCVGATIKRQKKVPEKNVSRYDNQPICSSSVLEGSMSEFSASSSTNSSFY